MFRWISKQTKSCVSLQTTIPVLPFFPPTQQLEKKIEVKASFKDDNFFFSEIVNNEVTEVRKIIMLIKARFREGFKILKSVWY